MVTMKTYSAPLTEASLSERPDSAMGDTARILLAVVFPPAGVALETGMSKTLLLNVFLTLLGYVPGIVHAVYIIAKK